MEQAGVQTRSQTRQEEACEEEVSLAAIMKFRQEQRQEQSERQEELKVQLQEQSQQLQEALQEQQRELQLGMQGQLDAFVGEMKEEQQQFKEEIYGELQQQKCENGWDDRQRAVQIATSLKGAAMEILGQLSVEESNSYRSLVEVLERRYGTMYQTEVYRARFWSRVRAWGEPLQQLAHDLQNIAHKAYPGAAPNMLVIFLRDQFIDALDTVELNVQVKQAQPRTMQEALARALEFESYVRKPGHKREDCYKLKKEQEQGSTRKSTFAPKECWTCGTLEVQIKVAGQEATLPVYVAEMEDQCLLGLDYLLSRIVSSSFDSNLGVVEPDVWSKTNAGVMVGRTLVEMSGGEVPVVVANFSREPQKIKEGELVGLCQEMDHEWHQWKVCKRSVVKEDDNLPDHIHDLFLRSCQCLDDSQVSPLRELLVQFADIFSTSDLDLGCTDMVEHSINTGDRLPIKQPARRMAPAQRQEMEKVMENLRSQGVIEKSSSPWKSAMILVRKKDGSKFEWTAVTQKAFDELKQALVSSPVLPYPDQSQPFILDCDASDHGIGGVLSQNKGDQEYVVAYYSKKLSPPELNYCVIRKELLAVVKSLDFFHPYLYGSYFIIRTDHGALKWLKTLKNLVGPLARWLRKIDQHNYEVQHRPGRIHGNADSLNRRPCEPECKQCSKKEEHSKKCNRTAVTELVSAEEDLVRMQLEDADLQPVIEWLQQSTERPSWQEVSRLSLTCKSYWSQWDLLHLNNGLLEHQWETSDGLVKYWQLVVLKKLRSKILNESHNQITSGHLAVKKTLSRLRFY
ncbi:hypothetical protein Pcinc_006948 [Petrolisthes cinctipes]|uniref:Reverse transcriptase/retrotransposon-derived protein RNase H-like domain-containing protein n=1 Tax=Petrolisthes cinctipes TaxID=88211 RepID=A0AAE1KYP4_PETCI|nr:hypothetical protein Pcinc_006948 [Petrolisthes cinctipes]